MGGIRRGVHFLIYHIKAHVVGPGEGPKRVVEANIAGAQSEEDARLKFSQYYAVIKFQSVTRVETVQSSAGRRV